MAGGERTCGPYELSELAAAEVEQFVPTGAGETRGPREGTTVLLWSRPRAAGGDRAGGVPGAAG